MITFKNARLSPFHVRPLSPAWPRSGVGTPLRIKDIIQIAAAGTVSSFVGAAALRQGAIGSASGGLSAFSGAAALRQGEAFTAAATVSRLLGVAVDEQGEVIVDIGLLTSFLGVGSGRQGELATVVGLAPSFLGAGALQEAVGGPPSFAAAGVVSSFQGDAALIEAVVVRSAGKRPTRLRRPLLEWSDGVPHAPHATSFNAFIAYGVVTSFGGSAATSLGAQAAGAGAMTGFTGAAAANSDLYLEEDELILLALAA